MEKLKGRPTNKQQQDLRKELLKYFNEGRSISYTAEHSKHPKDTVEKYWYEFRHMYTEEMNEDYVLRQRASREQALKKMDENIDRWKKIVDRREGDDANVKDYMNALKEYEALIERRAALNMIPTLDVDIKTLVVKEALKNEKPRLIDNS